MIGRFLEVRRHAPLPSRCKSTCQLSLSTTPGVRPARAGGARLGRQGYGRHRKCSAFTALMARSNQGQLMRCPDILLRFLRGCAWPLMTAMTCWRFRHTTMSSRRTARNFRTARRTIVKSDAYVPSLDSLVADLALEPIGDPPNGMRSFRNRNIKRPPSGGRDEFGFGLALLRSWCGTNRPSCAVVVARTGSKMRSPPSAGKLSLLDDMKSSSLPRCWLASFRAIWSIPRKPLSRASIAPGGGPKHPRPLFQDRMRSMVRTGSVAFPRGRSAYHIGQQRVGTRTNHTAQRERGGVQHTGLPAPFSPTRALTEDAALSRSRRFLEVPEFRGSILIRLGKVNLPWSRQLR